VPVGTKTLGRIMDVLGTPIDEAGPIGNTESWPIHRAAPSYEDQAKTTELLETGIKVIDLIMPISKGGKIGLFGGAGVGKTVTLMELIRNIAVEQRTRVGFVDVVPVALGDLERVIDLGDAIPRELHVHHGADDLYDLACAHVLCPL